MSASLRQPAVAGRFYPAEPDRLAALVARCLGPAVAERRAARMVMAPHAGYVYSGAVAGETYARVVVPGRAVLICPNHTGLGVRRSLWESGRWELPGFSLEVDAELARRVGRHADLRADHLAHAREHAIEVHLPFLHALRSDVRIVPICLGGLAYDECREVGEGLGAAITEHEQAGGEPVLIVASSDMSHYISAQAAERADRKALERVLALDPEGLFEVVEREEISMCGFIPTTVGLIAARALGATGAELVRYASSGDVSGDYDQVVGYAGVVIV